MKASSFMIAAAAVFATTACGQAYDQPREQAPGDDGKYELSAEGIRAHFIPYGASITNLFIKDKDGVERDIVLGFDNATAYWEDPLHPHLGGVPGRYANRIKNSSFVIDGERFDVTPNENDGKNQLHGGPDGWDYVSGLRVGGRKGRE